MISKPQPGKGIMRLYNVPNLMFPQSWAIPMFCPWCGNGPLSIKHPDAALAEGPAA